jgi:hypothetical protein
MPINMHEGIWKMFRNFRKSKMSTIEFTPVTKDVLRDLIDKEAKRVGSRTVAFENVARTIGASSSWIRKFITYEDRVAEPRMTLFQNIAAYYAAVCSRIEHEQQVERDKSARLLGDLNAVNASLNRMVESTTRTQAAREDH